MFGEIMSVIPVFRHPRWRVFCFHSGSRFLHHYGITCIIKGSVTELLACLASETTRRKRWVETAQSYSTTPSVFLPCLLLIPLLPSSREKEGKWEYPPPSSSLSHNGGGKCSQRSFIYCPASNEHVSHLTPPPCWGKNTEEARKTVKLKRWGAAVKSVFWTYEAIALVSTQQLCLQKTRCSALQQRWRMSTQDSIPSWGALGSRWLPEEEDSFLFGCVAPGKLSVHWGMASHPFIPRQHYLD